MVDLAPDALHSFSLRNCLRGRAGANPVQILHVCARSLTARAAAPDTAAVARRITLTLAALALMCFATPAAAAGTRVDPLAVANAAWPDSPCAGKLRLLVDGAVGSHRLFAEATGIEMRSDGSWQLISCDITVDPRAWRTSSVEHKCLLLVHEAGHLSGLIDHTATGVMASLPTTGSWPACQSLRTRIINAIAARTGSGEVTCSRWEGRILPCAVLVGPRERPVRYRARTRGDAFAISRVTPRTGSGFMRFAGPENT